MTDCYQAGSDPGDLFDCIGVGFGPSNIALAIALDEMNLMDKTLFFDSSDDVSWHPGMLIPGTDIQHNPLRDLVTPRNPQSPYGFLQYLKSQNRLFQFLNLAAHYPPRTEYAEYVKWVGRQFTQNVRFGSRVQSVELCKDDGEPGVYEVSLDNGEVFRSKTVSFGPGRSANTPAIFSEMPRDKVVHLDDYLFAKDRWCSSSDALDLLVLGGSQSAAEIALDLLNSPKVSKVTCLSRTHIFKHKDLSAFTEEIYFPEFTDYFHSLTTKQQNETTRELWRSNYGAADPDVVEALNLFLYEQQVTGAERLAVCGNINIVGVNYSDREGKIQVIAEHRHTKSVESYDVDGVILATGFKNFGGGGDQEPIHPLLARLDHLAAYRTDGGVAIARDYRLRFQSKALYPPLFVNGLCEATHGFGDAGSFSLLSVRSETIATSIRKWLSEYDSNSEIGELTHAI